MIWWFTLWRNVRLYSQFPIAIVISFALSVIGWFSRSLPQTTAPPSVSTSSDKKIIRQMFVDNTRDAGSIAVGLIFEPLPPSGVVYMIKRNAQGWGLGGRYREERLLPFATVVAGPRGQVVLADGAAYSSQTIISHTHQRRRQSRGYVLTKQRMTSY